MPEYLKILKANPYHDAEGRFASASAAGKKGKPYGQGGSGSDKNTPEGKLNAMSVDGKVNAEKMFGNKAKPKNAPIDGNGPAAYLYKSKRVSLDKIAPTQTSVDTKGVKEYLTGNGRSSAAPKVLLYPDGKYYVQDGHHRIAAALLRGETSMTVRMVKIKQTEPYLVW